MRIYELKLLYDHISIVTICQSGCSVDHVQDIRAATLFSLSVPKIKQWTCSIRFIAQMSCPQTLC